ncbi:MAG: DUF4381 family protein [Gammaproteobacteria bacterium]|nr:DUF4381 family protein [Gammaproteobacteria bacterium]
MPSPPVIINPPWVDLIEPTAPAPLLSGVDSVLLTLAVLGVLLIVARWWWRHPRQRALRRLRYLARRAQQTTDDPKQLAFALRQTLCSGMHVIQLHQAHLPPPQRLPWQGYCAALTQACYQPQSPTTPLLLELIEQARVWLRHTPLRHDR